MIAEMAPPAARGTPEGDRPRLATVQASDGQGERGAARIVVPDGMDPAKAEAGMLLRVLGGHGTWWWGVLARTRAWEWFIPWPMGRVLRRMRLDVRGDSAWFTASIGVTLYAIYHFNHGALEGNLKYAEEGAKVLFSGVFLLGTILSVSMAMPGQAIMKAVLARRPSYAIKFLVPFMWALTWGMAGAAFLFFMRRLASWTHPAVLFVAVYAAFMELHAITHAMRTYAIGLTVMSLDQINADAEKKAG